MSCSVTFPVFSTVIIYLIVSPISALSLLVSSNVAVFSILYPGVASSTSVSAGSLGSSFAVAMLLSFT